MGSDIFTSKCEAHNIIVPYRSTCPVCVSAKRAQLHAASMAHMPRYLFEQTLDVQADKTGLPKPVRSFMKAPEEEVAWGYRLNLLSKDVSTLSTNLFVDFLEKNLDKLGQRWLRLQSCKMNGQISTHSMFYTVWDTVIALYKQEAKQAVLLDLGAVTRMRADFVEHMVETFKAGQRIQEVPVSKPAQSPTEYKVNKPCHAYNGYLALHSTVQGMLQELDRCTDAKINAMRLQYQVSLDAAIAAEDKRRISGNLAIDMFYEVKTVLHLNPSTAVQEQFISYLHTITMLGHRLVPCESLVASGKYRLNIPSLSAAKSSYLNSTTQALFIQLDKCEQGALRMKLERDIEEVRPNLTEYHRRVNFMAETLWMHLPMVPGLRTSEKVRNQFIDHVTYLYLTCGQRIVEIFEPEVSKASEAEYSIVDRLQCFLMNDVELSKQRNIIESNLNSLRTFRTSDCGNGFQALVAAVCEKYRQTNMTGWKHINACAQLDLRERLIADYLKSRRP